MDKDRAIAEHVFTRILLSDLMVELCMQADDPIAEVERRSNLKIGAGYQILAKRADNASHLALQQFETFWEGVEQEVRQRVGFYRKQNKGD